jgi:Nitrate/nitrite transporter
MPTYIWFPVIIGLALGFVFMNIPPAADQFMEMYGVGHGGLAFLLSGLLWSHSLSQIPAGMVVDRLGTFRLLLLATFVGGCANLAPFLLLDNLIFATVCRFVIGLCTGVLFLTILKIVGSLAPEKDMPMAQGVYGGAFGFGTMLPFLVLPWFGESAWFYSYVIAGGIFFFAFVMAFFLPRKQLPTSILHDENKPSLRTTLSVVLRSKPIWALGIIHGFSYGTMNNTGQWLPSILADLSSTPITKWSLAATAVLFLGSTARSLSGSATRFMTRAQILSGTVFAVAVCFICLGASQWVWVTLVFGLVLGFISGLNYGSIFTIGSWVLAPVYMATALGLLNMIANITNVLLTLLLGNVREQTGSFSAGLYVAGIVAFVVWFFTRKIAVRQDLVTREK